MPWSVLSSAIGGAFGLGSSAIQKSSADKDRELQREALEWQKQVEEKNFAFQKEQYEYSKSLQDKIFEREDTSIQRRKADLINAGINPLLAAGSGAGAGSVVPTQAPQMDSSFMSGVMNMTPSGNMAQGLADLGASIAESGRRYLESRHTGAQIDVLKAQERNLATQDDKMRAEISNYEESTKNMELDRDLKRLDITLKEQSVEVQNGLKKFALDAGYPPELIQKADPSTLLMFYSGYQLSQDLENIAVPIAQLVSRFPYLRDFPIEKTANMLYNGFRFFAGASGQVVPKSKIIFKRINGVLQKMFKRNEVNQQGGK